MGANLGFLQGIKKLVKNIEINQHTFDATSEESARTQLYKDNSNNLTLGADLSAEVTTLQNLTNAEITSVQAGEGFGQRFEVAFSKEEFLTEFSFWSLSTGGTGTVTGTISVYDNTDAKELYTEDISWSIDATATKKTFSFDSKVFLDPSHEIEVRVVVNTTATTHRIEYQTTDVLSNSIRVRSSDGGQTWPTSATTDLRFEVKFAPRATSGSLIEIITPDELYEWKKANIKKTLLADSDIVWNIKDPDTDTIITGFGDISDKESLTGIDSKLYKSIKSEILFTEGTGGELPTLYYRGTSWQGNSTVTIT